MRRFRVLIVLSLLPFARAAAMQTYEDAKLLASDGTYQDHFGSAVSTCASHALVGAPFHGPDALERGAAYVFERQPNGTWLEVAKLLGHEQAHSSLGESVSMWG